MLGNVMCVFINHGLDESKNRFGKTPPNGLDADYWCPEVGALDFISKDYISALYRARSYLTEMMVLYKANEQIDQLVWDQ